MLWLWWKTQVAVLCYWTNWMDYVIQTYTTPVAVGARRLSSHEPTDAPTSRTGTIPKGKWTLLLDNSPFPRVRWQSPRR